ncbi:uncharacterized protein LOC113507051 isoform X2 [Trichoplusia ni]|uniref:Uncharacterized protein LOC113507051 isoform X2 n=1 Tax=Trichoplusia ni TaxID=7111 RepID=A0A7E5WZT7_TRINI|nr:uncharacterized protein LOC113507051 isoform X2 [Trichoplusia ni]
MQNVNLRTQTCDFRIFVTLAQECVERCAGKRSAIKDGGPLYRPLLSVTRGVQNVEMTTVGCRCVVVVAACVLAAALVSAQITFSRDWTGGKRAAPQLALDCGQFTRLCRHFVHELKQALTSEMTSKHHQELDKPLYDEE